MTLPIPSEMTAAVGAILTAAQWNSNVRDGINFLVNPPICVMYASTGQALANNTATDITFDTELVDSYNGHSTVTNTARYTAQIAGWYLILGEIEFAGNATGRRTARVNKNGANYTPDMSFLLDVVGAPGPNVQFVALVNLAVNDWVTVNGFQNDGASMTLGTQSWMGALWVHA